MEAVWLKTEPDDDDSCFAIKLETGIDINVIEPLTNSGNDFKRRQRKQKLVSSSTKSDDGKKVEKKPRDKKLNNRSYICDVCDKQFTCGTNLRRHKLLHTGIKQFVCPEENCGAAFCQNYALKAHQITHAKERKPGERFFCEVCGLGFLSKFYLQFHQRTKHTGDRPFACKECGEGFARRTLLNKHLLEHSGNRPFECDECGMKFYERKLLKSHKKTHTADGMRPFSCEECGKGFFHKTSLNAHQRNHLTVRPFGCEICGKRFVQKGALNVHKVVHSDVRPFECKECGLRYTQQYTLKTHRMKQHGLSTVPVKQPKTTGAESKTVSHNDNILGYGNTQPLEPSEINAGGNTMDPAPKSSVPLNELTDASEKSEINAKSSIDPTPKSIVPLNITVDLNELTDATESGFEAKQPDETIKIEKSSLLSVSESSYSECGLETNDGDEPTKSEDNFAVDHKIGALHPPFIGSTGISQIKEESTEIFEPPLDICKSEPTTSDDDYDRIETAKPIEKEGAVENTCRESTQRLFACNKCERKFARVSSLKIHQHVHERAATTEKPSFMCDECGKNFHVKRYLQIHQRIHSGLTPFSCKTCGKEFNQLANMLVHQLIHTGERRFACETCGLRFGRKDTLQIHKQSHMEGKNFSCDVCGNKYKNPYGMKRHRLTHTSDTNYSCDICGKIFFIKYTLAAHLLKHTNEKPFACDRCPFRTNMKGQLGRHKKYSHREIGEPSEYQKRKLAKMMKLKKMVDGSL